MFRSCLLFVSFDVNPQGFAFFGGDKSHRVYELDTSLSHVILTQVFTAELLMGTQSDNL
jgi:hypothetical protein